MGEQCSACSRLYKVPNEDLKKVTEELEEYKKKMKGTMTYSIKWGEKESYILVSYIVKKTTKVEFRVLSDMMDFLMLYLYIVRSRQDMLYWQREKENQEAILLNHYKERMEELTHKKGFYHTL